MGVHGLTSYLKANRSSLAQTLHLAPSIKSADERQQVIVDGWSLIYAVYRAAQLPWVYGGEYAAFEHDIRRLVTAWRGVGLEPVVVFDGPTPQAKFPTVEKRLDQNRKDLLLTYRSGPAGRLSQAGTFVLPPLCYSSCLFALTVHPSNDGTDMFEPVEVHFADSEGDPFTVELARQRSVWVLGTDSDFIVYIGSVCGEGTDNAEGMGYCPLDEMVWVVEDSVPGTSRPDTPSAGSSSAWGDEEEFREVRSRRRKTTRNAGLLPSPGATTHGLKLTFYAPLALSNLLNLPPTHLPLLASFLGTDYTPATMRQHFHPQSNSPVQNVERTANALRTASAQQSSSGTATPSGYNRALDLIMRAIEILALRPPLPSGLAIQLREAIISSTLQYALPVPGEPGVNCAVHPPDACELPQQLVPSAFDDYPAAATKPLYLKAYREGMLAPELLDLIATGTFWPSVFLEDPDAGSVAVWVGREIRQWVYAIVDQAVGVYEEPDPDEMEDEMEDGEEGEETLANGDDDDEDELIPVEEMDSDEEPAWVTSDKRASMRAAAQVRARERRETELYHGYLPEDGVAQPDNSPELRSLHAALWRLRGGRNENASVDGGSAPLSRVMSVVASPPNGRVRRVQVTEYVRRAQAIKPEKVDVRQPIVGDLFPEGWRWMEPSRSSRVNPTQNIPVIVRSESERVRVLLHALQAEGTGIMDPANDWDDATPRWSSEECHLALSTRWAIMKGAEKGGEARWKRSELEALAAVIFPSSDVDREAPSTVPVTPLENRPIALAAQLLHAMENIAWLAQALLISALCGQGECRLSGRALHAALLNATGKITGDAKRWCAAVEQGLGDDMWFEDRRKEKKKGRGGSRSHVGPSGSNGSPFGMFGALEGLPAE
ncbi:hypothetical protein DACRYDRAFT_112538 [Dacryopinax primogenitus]|uniref:PIN domain-like protein n=1 Tax=Dacryopinax primogenitus (strain DJM 731) TaxID=1858805 RepID=M5FP22_DACPD|nr:uncharacterized protein DACRYDRAFT_112538 [Dacryopinax primogenitus]EJT96733.1 hypothetical protein DACRYDRAFT_112538 [Dacryopinax primogenitus]